MTVSIDRGFDGSAATIGTSNIGLLTEFRHNNQPATARTSGAGSAGHTYAAGRNNQGVTVGFLGSKACDAGSVIALAATLNDGTSYTFPNLAVTQLRISGRKDGAIEGSLTGKVSGITGSGNPTFSVHGVEFNGTTASFSSTPIPTVDIVSVSYEATCAEVDSAGAGATDVLTSPGIPDRTVTIEVMGGATLSKGAIGALAIGWNDGGTLGSGTYWQITGIRDGGGLDDAITTEYTFKAHAATA
jgi:hypothetical protein